MSIIIIVESKKLSLNNKYEKELKKMKKYLMFDTETANGFKNPMVYDIGLAVIDENGRIYKTYSFVVRNIFYNRKMMRGAYYADKLPQYRIDIKNGERKVVDFKYVQKVIATLMERYNIEEAVAHNVSFDKRSTSSTYNYVVPNSIKEFFPADTIFLDTLAMARNILKEDEDFYHWCWINDGLSAKTEKPKFSAENLYRYITDNPNFIESHTALADVLIEKEIFSFLMKKGLDI